MKNLIFFAVITVVFLNFSNALMSHIAGKPAETSRGNCPDTAQEDSFWFTFTDTDGDGEWDWISGKKCDGTLENRALEEDEISFSRALSGEADVSSGTVANGMDFVLELKDDNGNSAASLTYVASTASYTLTWLAPPPAAYSPEEDYESDRHDSKSNNHLSDSDKLLIRKMEKIYKGINSEMKVFPNPSQETISIQLRNFDNSDGTIIISDLNGKKVFNNNIGQISDNHTIELNTSQLQTGTYIITVFSGTNSISQKIIVR